MTAPDIQFEIPTASADPKDMRALLLQQLLAHLETEIENTDPHYLDEEHFRGRVPSPYWQIKMRVDAYRHIARAVRSMLRTVEEYLVFDRENSGTPAPTEAELECARHRDRCTVCVDQEMVTHRMQREQDKLEQVRAIYVTDIHKILNAIDNDKQTIRAGEEPNITVTAIQKQLNRTLAAAHKRMQREEP